MFMKYLYHVFPVFQMEFRGKKSGIRGIIGLIAVFLSFKSFIVPGCRFSGRHDVCILPLPRNAFSDLISRV